MPVNPQQLHEAMQRIGRSVLAAQESARAARATALQLLRTAASAPEQVRASVKEAAAEDPRLRCAVPLQEKLDATLDCPARMELPPILAVDGSQIDADRHQEIQFALINTAAVTIFPGSGKTPSIVADTRLIFGDELFTAADRPMSEGDLALERDLAERASLLKNSAGFQSLVALGDGPLELWGAKDAADPRAFQKALQDYLSDLRELQTRGILLAGYIDKPAADPVIRMLALHEIKSGGDKHGRLPNLRGASDRLLFGSMLAPGQRSAVFGLQSASALRYTGDLALHFFYLNVGHAAQSALARIEIPGWVARDAGRVDVLHRAVLDQCALLGARPYPYVLHRAHESAVISAAEREQIKLRLLLEMRDHGIEPEHVSGKSYAKSHRPGPRRHRHD